MSDYDYYIKKLVITVLLPEILIKGVPREHIFINNEQRRFQK